MDAIGYLSIIVAAVAGVVSLGITICMDYKMAMELYDKIGDDVDERRESSESL